MRLVWSVAERSPSRIHWSNWMGQSLEQVPWAIEELCRGGCDQPATKRTTMPASQGRYRFLTYQRTRVGEIRPWTYIIVIFVVKKSGTGPPSRKIQFGSTRRPRNRQAGASAAAGSVAQSPKQRGPVGNSRQLYLIAYSQHRFPGRR